MKSMYIRWGCLCLLIPWTVQAGDVVINEIMYYPPHALPEDTREEWLELFNRGSTTISLRGWQFTRGVSFTFTNPVTLPAGGYLVVAADVAAFQARYPGVANVVGGWTGQLANGGEQIELRNAAGGVETEVSYSNGGDWGVRLRGAGEDRVWRLTNNATTAYAYLSGNFGGNDTVVISGADQPEYNGTFAIFNTANAGFRYTMPATSVRTATGIIISRQLTDFGHLGWAWSSRADGLGASLELINPAMPNAYGQNWAASRTLIGGTPGRANSGLANNIAPLILEPRHVPVVPRSIDPITITTRILDEQASGITVTLHYRVDSATPPPFSTTAMLDDGEHNDGQAGDGLYGTVLPPQANNTVVEFYIEARDASGLSRTWPTPALDTMGQFVQDANALMQVDDTSWAGPNPVYRIIMREQDRAELQTHPSVAPNSNARMNTTFITVEPSGETEVRYTAGVRDRGAGSRYGNPANYQVRVPGDQPWHGVETCNLNINYTHSQYAGYVLASLSGLNTEAARIVRVLVNNENRATSSTRNFGYYIQLESTDGSYVDSHFPNDPEGNVYRGSTGNHSADLTHRGSDYVRYLNAGYFKQNNTAQNNWNDLTNLTYVLSTASDAEYAQRVREVADVEEWMTYFAVYSLLLSRETSLATGRGDDFSMFFGVNDPRCLLLSHDWDTILNEGDNRPGTYTDSIFRMCPAVNATANTTILNRFMLHPEFAQIYFQELKRLAETVFAPTNLAATLDQALGSWVPQDRVDRMKAFSSNRVANVLSQIPQALTAKTLPVVALTNPVSGSVYAAPVNITLRASASDSLGIARVEFYSGNTRLGQDATSPYTYNWNSVAAGDYSLRAVATDLAGLATTSDVVSITVTSAPSIRLVSSNSVWKYLDNGSDQGTAWRAVSFDDSGWQSGRAQLGYGDGDEATVVQYGPNQLNKYVTTYFRQAFSVTNAASVSALSLWLLRDDGAVVYLNGTEIYRSPSMPAGTITSTTLAIATGENTVDTASIGGATLLTGLNEVAVELHQQDVDSSDISFDFQLDGILGGSPGLAGAPQNEQAIPPVASPLPPNTVQVGGQVNALQTRAITVNGVPALLTVWQGLWRGQVALNPGVNRILVQALDVAGTEIERTWLTLGYNTGFSNIITSPITANTTWVPGSGPYHVIGNLAIQTGATLTIEAGTTVFFAENAGWTVNGRLMVNGTETNRVRFTGATGAADSWAGLRFINAQGTNSLTCLDLEFAGSAGHSVQVSNSIVLFNQCSFSGSTRTYIDLLNASFAIRNSEFASIAGAEMIHGTGIRSAGSSIAIIEGNLFGTTTGLNDIIDFTGGQRPGPILQILNNVFTAASDDHLDLDGTDAHIEGNIFMHAHQGTPGDPDTSSAISGGQDGGNTSELVIVRNLFYDCDHAVLAKEGNFYTLENNTIVHMTQAAVNFNEPLRNLAPGLGATLNGNIIWDTPVLFANYTSGVMQVTVDRSILPTNFPGTGNLVADPRFVNSGASPITYRTITNDFRLGAGSPALGTGPNGLDMGAFVPSGASISGEPPSPTAQTTATLTVAGPSIAHYRWSLNGDAYRPQATVATPITLAGLANGSYTVSVIGRNDALVWQSTNRPTVSKTWTVNSTLSRIVINEVLARNNTAVLVGSRHPDLIELYNAGGVTVDLSGMGITDDPVSPLKFSFPPGTTLAPGAYLTLVADDPDGTANLFTGFGLNADGDGVYLFGAAGNLVDSVTFGPQVADYSIGRLAGDTWGLTRPSFGATNVAALVGDTDELCLNEWLAGTRSAFSTDFIELYNRDSLPVALGGLLLTDNPIGWPTQHVIAPLSFIGSNGFALFYADGDPGAGSNHVSFRLSTDRGALALLTPGLAILDQITYPPQIFDISQGRQPDGALTIAFLSPPTPGGPNPGPPPVVSVTNIVVPLFGVTNKLWRYSATGTDLGTAWRALAYNDSAWTEGRGLFGQEPDIARYPYPINTVILAPPNGGPLTAYFRTHFQWTNAEPGFTLYLTNYLDDGAVFYLNGVEIGRVRISSGTVSYNTLAQNQGSEGQADIVSVPGTNLVLGDNVIAVELHQGNATSSDDIFGLGLTAINSITNTALPRVVINEVLANNASYTNADGTLTDWVELFNPSDRVTDLADMSLTDDTLQPRRWVFPVGVTLPARSYLIVRFDPDSPATTNVGAVFNTGFGLGADTGDQVYLYDSTANGRGLMDAVTFGIQAADFSVGRIANGSGAFALNIPTRGSANIAAILGTPDSLRINEWMADPNGGDDWFEIYNPLTAPVAVGGLYLTDDLNDRTKSHIPALSFIGPAPAGFVELRADGNLANGANHVSFRLSGTGEAIGLYRAGGSAIDAITFGRQDNGVSEGRFPDGTTNIVRFPGTDTPGASNLLPIDSVAVNEVLTHTDLPLEDAIELHNLTPASLDVSGWYLTDNKNAPRKFRIPPGSIIEPDGYLAFYEYQFNPFFTGIPPGFALSGAQGDQVYLFRADTDGNLLGFRGGVSFDAAENGVSFGRYETSVGVDFTAMNQLTFGTSVEAGSPTNQIDLFRTGRGAVNALPKVGPVVINEIMYHPPDIQGTNDDVLNEYVELWNVTGAPVSLYDTEYSTNRWRLRDAVDFAFPEGTVVPGGAFLLVVSFDPTTNAVALAAFRSKYGLSASVPIVGPYDGKLANNNDSVELTRPDHPLPPGDPDAGYVPRILVDKVKYYDDKPWPTNADGAGQSLQRANSLAYGNDPVNWVAANPTPGAANGPAVIAPPVITGQPASQTVLAGSNVVLAVVATGAAPLNYQWRFQGKDIPGAVNATLLLPDVQFFAQGRYTVRVSNPGGSAISTPATLSVMQAPLITRQPQGGLGALGGTFMFDVVTAGTLPLGYQWQREGTNIAGATGPVFVLNNIVATDEALYRVVASNAYGMVTSAWAFLTLHAAPAIIIQPTGTNVLVGDPATFQVLAAGIPPLFYQWQYNGVNIAGATNPVFTIASAQLAQAGNYTVQITNRINSVISAPATLIVTLPPVVTVTAPVALAAEPANNGLFLILRGGDTAEPLTVHFNVSGTATSGVDYRALASPATIPAGTNAVAVAVEIVDNPAKEPDETVVLTLVGAHGYAVGVPGSATVMILDKDNVRPTVVISSPPAGSLFTGPTNLTITAEASDEDGAIALVEFYADTTNKIGQVVSAEAAFSVTWTNVPGGDHLLTAVATDDLGARIASAPVFISVSIPRVGFSDPFAQSGIVTGFTNTILGTNTTFTRETGEPNHAGTTGGRSGWLTWTATSSGTVTMDTFGSSFDTVLAIYTNRQASMQTLGTLVAVASNDDAPGGTTTASKVIFNVVAGAIYQIVVDGYSANDYGVIVFHMSMANSGPVITLEPQSQSVVPGSIVTFTAQATGPVPLAYQWQLNGTGIPGAISTNLTLLNVQSANEGVYTLAVSNTTGYAISQRATLTLLVAPTILLQPLNVVTDVGRNATFRVIASGTAPLTYQWRFNGTNIPGATGSSFTRATVQYVQGGAYSATVSNSMGSVSSASAELIVRPRLLSVAPTNTSVQVLWNGTPGRAYMVEMNPSLGNSTNWQGLGAVTNAAVQSQFIDSTVAGSTQRVYRLRVAP